LRRKIKRKMLHIKMQKTGVNLMKDTELLDPMYIPLINKFDL